MWNALFEIIELVAVIVFFLIWLSSLLWAIATRGLDQVGRDKKWIKRYVYCFIALFFFSVIPLITGFAGVWHFSWVEDVQRCISVLFVVIVGYMALIGGGSSLFDGKQNEALLREYRECLNYSAGTLTEHVYKSLPNEDFQEFTDYFMENAKRLESCYQQKLKA